MSSRAIFPFLMLCMASCSNVFSKSSKVVWVSGDDVINFNGPITPTSANDFLELARKFDSQFTLNITSAGGDASSSLDIANLVEERNASVNVKKFCMSGCAYIFLSARQKKVETNSIVGFHNTVKSNNDLIQHSFIYSGQRMSGIADKREVDLFMRKGISLEILDKADDVLGALCVGNAKSPTPVSDGKQVAFGWKAHSWTLSLEEMRRLGVKNIEGYWPSSQKELDSIYNLHFKSGFSGYYIGDLSNIIDRKPRLPACFY
jgi:hypothetical protein